MEISKEARASDGKPGEVTEEGVEEGFHLHGAGNWEEKVEALWRNYKDEEDGKFCISMKQISLA